MTTGPPVWPQVIPPAVHEENSWTWSLRAPVELAGARADLAARLHALPPGSPSMQASDALLLAFDELAVNAMTHVGPPVLAQVHRGPLPERHEHSWLITVRDDSPQDPPQPIEPHTEGGYGLLLVQALAVDYGWVVVPPTKTVWALMNMTGWC